MSEESLDAILPYIHAFNIDLKSMSNKFYEKICNAKVESVLDNIKKIYHNGNHIEITNLIIPNLIVQNEMLESLTDFILTELGKRSSYSFFKIFSKL